MDKIMNNYFKLFTRIILPTFFIAACTQFLEETESSHAVAGTDGCVYCHTNDERLKVLAEEEDDGHAGGGG